MTPERSKPYGTSIFSAELSNFSLPSSGTTTFPTEIAELTPKP